MGKKSKKRHKNMQTSAVETKDKSNAASVEFSKKDYERELFKLQVERSA